MAVHQKTAVDYLTTYIYYCYYNANAKYNSHQLKEHDRPRG